MFSLHSRSFAVLYACSLEQAEYIAELCGCSDNLIFAPYGSVLSEQALSKRSSCPQVERYYGWEDRPLAGGAIRITWMPVRDVFEGGLMWLSSHSGYPNSDLTDDAAEFAAELGYRAIGYESEWMFKNPRIYGSFDLAL